MLAAIARNEDLEIDEDESKVLAKSINEVSKFYMNLETSEKTVAWINLSMALGQVYGPRIMASKIRRMRNTQHRPTSQTQQYQQPRAAEQTRPMTEQELTNVTVFAPKVQDGERGTG